MMLRLCATAMCAVDARHRHRRRASLLLLSAVAAAVVGAMILCLAAAPLTTASPQTLSAPKPSLRILAAEGEGDFETRAEAADPLPIEPGAQEDARVHPVPAIAASIPSYCPSKWLQSTSSKCTGEETEIRDGPGIEASQQETRMQIPEARAFHSGVHAYHPLTKNPYMVVYGGCQDLSLSDDALDDTWLLDLVRRVWYKSTFVERPGARVPAVPPKRLAHAATVDVTKTTMLIFGGFHPLEPLKTSCWKGPSVDVPGCFVNELWVLTADAGKYRREWDLLSGTITYNSTDHRPLSHSDANNTEPDGRAGHTFTLVEGVNILFGGARFISLGEDVKRNMKPIIAEAQHSDEALAETRDAFARTSPYYCGGLPAYHDRSPKAGSSTFCYFPSPSTNSSAYFDVGSSTRIDNGNGDGDGLFGNAEDIFDDTTKHNATHRVPVIIALNDTWHLHFSAFANGTTSHRWERVVPKMPPGHVMHPRHSHSAVTLVMPTSAIGLSDGASREMLLLFGGTSSTKYPVPSDAEFYNDLWVYDAETTTWALLIDNYNSKSPPARHSHVAVATASSTMIIQGGYGAEGDPRRDTWEFFPNTTSWVKLTPWYLPEHNDLLDEISTLSDNFDYRDKFASVGVSFDKNSSLSDAFLTFGGFQSDYYSFRASNKSKEFVRHMAPAEKHLLMWRDAVEESGPFKREYAQAAIYAAPLPGNRTIRNVTCSTREWRWGSQYYSGCVKPIGFDQHICMVDHVSDAGHCWDDGLKPEELRPFHGLNLAKFSQFGLPIGATDRENNLQQQQQREATSENIGGNIWKYLGLDKSVGGGSGSGNAASATSLPATQPFLWDFCGDINLLVHGGIYEGDPQHSPIIDANGRVWRIAVNTSDWSVDELQHSPDATFPVTRLWHTFTRIDGHIDPQSHLYQPERFVVFGGQYLSSSNKTLLDDFFIFSPSKQGDFAVWTPLLLNNDPGFPLRRAGHAAAAVTNITREHTVSTKIFYFGGFIVRGWADYSGLRRSDAFIVLDVQKKEVSRVFAPDASGNVTQLLPPVRWSHTMSVMQFPRPFLILFGGESGDQRTSTMLRNDLWIFDVQNNKWLEVRQRFGEAWPKARAGHAAGIYGTKLLVYGGKKNYGSEYKTDYECAHFTYECGFSDLWELDLATFAASNGRNVQSIRWRLLKEYAGTDVVPSVRHAAHAMVGTQLTLFGGYQGSLGLPSNVLVQLRGGCTEGSSSPDYYMEGCRNCSAGTYSPDTGQLCCQSCPPQTWTSHSGASAPAQCSICSPASCIHGTCELSATTGVPDCMCSSFIYTDRRCEHPVIIYVLVAVVAFVAAFMLLVSYRRRSKLRKLKRQIHEQQTERELAEMNQSWRIDVSDLENLRYISEGAYSTVYSADWLGMAVAVKRLRLALFELNPVGFAKEFDREMRVMRSVRHANIVTFYGAGSEGGVPFLVTEFMANGSLQDVLREQDITRPLPLDVRLRYALDAAKGMRFLHFRKPPWIHRDLKTDNLLVSASYVVKVADFGTSRLASLESSWEVESGKQTNQKGSRRDPSPARQHGSPQAHAYRNSSDGPGYGRNEGTGRQRNDVSVSESDWQSDGYADANNYSSSSNRYGHGMSPHGDIIKMQKKQKKVKKTKKPKKGRSKHAINDDERPLLIQSFEDKRNLSAVDEEEVRRHSSFNLSREEMLVARRKALLRRSQAEEQSQKMQKIMREEREKHHHNQNSANSSMRDGVLGRRRYASTREDEAEASDGNLNDSYWEQSTGNMSKHDDDGDDDFNPRANKPAIDTHDVDDDDDDDASNATGTGVGAEQRGDVMAKRESPSQHQHLDPFEAAMTLHKTHSRSNSKAATSLELTGNVGTPLYQAPEVMTNQPYSVKADVYSFGITLWEIYTGTLPFQDLPTKSIVALKDHVVAGGRPDIPLSCPLPLERLMERCWHPNPRSRPAFDEIVRLLLRMSDEESKGILSGTKL